MTNDPLYQQVREISWRRKLTAAEEGRLKALLLAHPELQAEWEAEAGLNAGLGRLPDAPVASNFTARVMQEVERQSARELKGRRAGWGLWQWQLRWLPRLACVLIVLGVVAVSYHHFETKAERVELARNVATVSDAISDSSALASPEVLENFDAIYALKPLPSADEELLTLLQ
jgi:hypothetical protein